jgi:hypothetical protein
VGESLDKDQPLDPTLPSAKLRLYTDWDESTPGRLRNTQPGARGGSSSSIALWVI